ncbi:MAG: hypothetical protein IKS63_01020 [Firmicutes bacterium]|nr:hypothetical protein [Bacillota bacterium]
MTYSNAYEGSKKLIVAEILVLIVAVGGIAVQVMLAGGVQTEIGTAKTAASIGTLCMIVTIVAYIVNLVGLNQAGKDEPFFKTAFAISLITVLVSVASSVLTAIGYESIQSIASLAGEILQIFIIIYVISGIVSLAQRMKDTKLEQTGKKMLPLIPALMFISILVRLVNDVFGKGGETVAGAVNIGTAAITFAAGIIYLILLVKAAKALGRR